MDLLFAVFAVKSKNDLHGMSSSRRSRLFLFLAGLILALALTETCFRFYVWVFKPLYRPSALPGMGWEFTPGAVREVVRKDGSSFFYRINKRGFRDHQNGPWAGWEGAGLKIALLGDSVTAGAKVPYDKTYSALLESELAQKGIKARTANWGLDASNTPQHFILLKERVLRDPPDLILLGFFMNDIEMRPLDRLPPLAQTAASFFQSGIFFSQRLIQMLRNRQEAGRYHPAETGCGGYVGDTLSSYETSAWDQTAGWIRQMHDLARQRGIGFRVLLFPFSQEVSGECPDTARRIIRSFLEQQNIPFLDIAEVFQGSSVSGLYMPRDPAHLSPGGHGAVARAAADWLTKP